MHTLTTTNQPLIVHTDGGARGNPGPAAIGVFITDSQQTPLFELSDYLGVATNNEAEYKAVIAAADWITTHVETSVPITFYLDSLLVVNQLKGTFKITKPHLQTLLQSVQNKLKDFTSITFNHVPRAQNSVADALVNKALDAVTIS